MSKDRESVKLCKLLEWSRHTVSLSRSLFVSVVNNVGMNYAGMLVNLLDVPDPEKVKESQEKEGSDT